MRRSKIWVAFMVTLAVVLSQFTGLLIGDHSEVRAAGNYSAIDSFYRDINIYDSVSGLSFKGYCINSNKSSFASGDVFTEVDNSDLLSIMSGSGYSSSDALEANIKRCIYVGYPMDAIGLQEELGLSDTEFISATQAAIWYYTNNKSAASTKGGEDIAFAAASVPDNVELLLLKNSDSKKQNAAVLLLTSPQDSSTPVGSVTVHKTNTSSDQLGGAKFSLKMDRTYLSSIYHGGEYVDWSSVTATQNGTAVTLEPTMDSSGNMIGVIFTTDDVYDTVINNLPSGVYVLNELEAPDGYQLANTSTFKIVADSTGYKVYRDDSIEYRNDNVYSICPDGKLTVINYRTDEALPILPGPTTLGGVLKIWKFDYDKLDSNNHYLPTSMDASLGGATLKIYAMNDLFTSAYVGFPLDPIDLSVFVYQSGAQDTPVYNAADNSWTFTTVAGQPVIFDNVPDGYYVIEEIEAPEGYLANCMVDANGDKIICLNALVFQENWGVSTALMVPATSSSGPAVTFLPGAGAYDPVPVSFVINWKDPDYVAPPTPTDVPEPTATPTDVPEPTVTPTDVPVATPTTPVTPSAAPTATPVVTTKPDTESATTDDDADSAKASPTVTPTSTSSSVSTGETANNTYAMLAVTMFSLSVALAGIYFAARDKKADRNKYRIRKPML